MALSEEEKRQIINELAQGKPELRHQEPPRNSLQNDQEEAENYENFDDFARRSSQNESRADSSRSFESNDSDGLVQLKAQITQELNQAQAVGQLRVERIRDIVQSAVTQTAQEIKFGSSDIRLIVRSVLSAVSESLQETRSEIKEEVTAAIEGAIEGINSWRHQSIAKTQVEVKQLQEKLETEEDQLQQEIERLLTDFKETAKDTSPKLKVTIESAINTLANSEEVALMRKRYAQLQAQAAILRANLAARYGGRTEEVNRYLEEAKNWYNRSRPQAEAVVQQVEQKHLQLEEKLGKAGVGVAQKERQLRQILGDLLKTAVELFREKEPDRKSEHSQDKR